MKKSLVYVAGMMLLATSAEASVQDLITNVKNKNITAVRQMLNEGEDVNEQNEQGSTALHYAIALDDAEMTRLLLENGANLNIANKKGWTPLKIAEQKNVKNVTAVLSDVAKKVDAVAANKQNETQTIAAERQLLQRAAAAVEEARDAEKTALAAQEEAETKALILQSKVAMLEKTLAEKSKALATAEQKIAESAKVKNEAIVKTKEKSETKNIKTKQQSKQPIVPQKTAKPKPAPKPAPVKVLVPQPSKFHTNMTDGDDEVVYCLNLLGHGENQHMMRAAEFYAANNGVKEAHYQQIVSYADEFYASADNMAMKQRVDTCGKIITPNNATQQNKIIRSLNQALGH